MRDFHDYYAKTLVLSMICGLTLLADAYGVDENQDSFNNPAFVVTPLTGLPSSGYIQNVSINSSGEGLIIGEDFRDTPKPFVAKISSSSQLLTTLSGLPKSSIAYTVAINSLGNGLIGGKNLAGSAPAFAGKISSSTKEVTLFKGLPVSGYIQSVAINISGDGLLGGQDMMSGNPIPFLAKVSALSDVAVPLKNLPKSGAIRSVAINTAGAGLIGGYDSSNGTLAPFAAKVFADVVTPLMGLPKLGAVNIVAMNASGAGLIGGRENHSHPFAAKISLSSDMITPLLGLPQSGSISSIAINESGAGLIGVRELSDQSPAFAAKIEASSNQLVPLQKLPSLGYIESVAINEYGDGIIGGKDCGNQSPFAAKVSHSSNTVIPLTGLPQTALIESTAINSSGNGLIGGQTLHHGQPSAFAALVSRVANETILVVELPIPDPHSMMIDPPVSDSSLATADPLFSDNLSRPMTDPPISIIFSSTDLLALLLPSLSHIDTTGLHGNNLTLANYLNDNSPDDAFYFVPSTLNGTLAQALENVAPTSHAFDIFIADNNFFSLGTSFTQHAEDTRHYWAFQESYCSGMKKTQKKDNKTKTNCSCKLSTRPYQLWAKAIGTTARQKAQHQAHTFQPWVSGVILGFDAHSSATSTYGLGSAYTHTNLHQRKDTGHSRFNQEYLFAYGMWNNAHFYGDFAIWGGLVQIHNVRNMEITGFKFKATSHPKGWQLAPHAEAGYHNAYKITSFEPFVMLDWVNNWLGRYKEKGDGPFNFGQKEHYSSFLRTELGLRIYETIEFSTWRLAFQEKGSYVNKKPFDVGELPVYLVGAPGAFTVETLTTPQNLGVAAAKILFESNNPCYPYGSIAYQGEFGANYQSHQLSMNVGWNF